MMGPRILPLKNSTPYLSDGRGSINNNTLFSMYARTKQIIGYTQYNVVSKCGQQDFMGNTVEGFR